MLSIRLGHLQVSKRWFKKLPQQPKKSTNKTNQFSEQVKGKSFVKKMTEQSGYAVRSQAKNKILDNQKKFYDDLYFYRESNKIRIHLQFLHRFGHLAFFLIPYPLFHKFRENGYKLNWDRYAKLEQAWIAINSSEAEAMKQFMLSTSETLKSASQKNLLFVDETPGDSTTSIGNSLQSYLESQSDFFSQYHELPMLLLCNAILLVSLVKRSLTFGQTQGMIARIGYSKRFNKGFLEGHMKSGQLEQIKPDQFKHLQLCGVEGNKINSSRLKYFLGNFLF